MNLTEAYRKLGNTLVVPRQDLSAANDTGVCLSVWQVEMIMENGAPVLDTAKHAGPIELWRPKPGAKTRENHLEAALQKFDGYVDVVIVSGRPGENGTAGQATDAVPWLLTNRPGRWKVAAFDRTTGHFKLAVEPTM